MKLVIMLGVIYLVSAVISYIITKEIKTDVYVNRKIKSVLIFYPVINTLYIIGNIIILLIIAIIFLCGKGSRYDKEKKYS